MNTNAHRAQENEQTQEAITALKKQAHEIYRDIFTGATADQVAKQSGLTVQATRNALRRLERAGEIHSRTDRATKMKNGRTIKFRSTIWF